MARIESSTNESFEDTDDLERPEDAELRLTFKDKGMISRSSDVIGREDEKYLPPVQL